MYHRQLDDREINRCDVTRLFSPLVCRADRDRCVVHVNLVR